MKLIYEKSQAGRRASIIPRPEGLRAADVPEELRRSDPPRLPEVSELELVRHFTQLSTRNFGIDTGFYPLGSCTMKYNPRVNERIVMLPGFAQLHPHQDEDGAQGALELEWRLQEILAEVTGLDGVSLQPAAGSQGELTGLMLVRAYFADRGESEQRRKVVIPDTAHGTNPASVTMAGYEVAPVKTDARGNIDVDDLRAKVDEHTAALMLTNPSTLGLFDENIEEIERIFHGAGALMYYDGANLNAVCGISRPGDMGFDILHINLHKTSSRLHRARRRQEADGLRLPPADDLLPARRARGAHGRADGDRDEGDARRLLRRHARNRRRGGGRAEAAQGSAAWPAGQAARRGACGQAPGGHVRLRRAPAAERGAGGGCDAGAKRRL